MDGFKQRIIGAVVLVSLAVIFIPMIFEDPHQQKQTRVVPIPAKPEMPAFTIEVPKPPERIQSGIIEPRTESSLASENAPPASAKQLMTVAEAAGLETAQKSDSQNSAASRNGPMTGPEDDNHAVAGKTDRGASEGSSMATAAPANVTAAAKSVSDAATKPPTGPLSDTAWTVQIGTFKNRPGALKIRDELMESGTPSYTADIVSGGVAMMRVFAGPTESKEAAQKLKQKIDKRYKLQSLIVTYKAP